MIKFQIKIHKKVIFCTGLQPNRLTLVILVYWSITILKKSFHLKTVLNISKGPVLIENLIYSYQDSENKVDDSKLLKMKNPQNSITSSLEIFRLIPKNHRTIILPLETNGTVWRGELRPLTGKVHLYSCLRSKITGANFTFWHWRDLSNSIPKKIKDSNK